MASRSTRWKTMGTERLVMSGLASPPDEERHPFDRIPLAAVVRYF